MASAKIATLAIRTIAKPISTILKNQAQQHPTFRKICMSLAQYMYRTEVRLRANLLGDNPKHIKPLSEAKAIQNGANALAEGFLFAVAAGLIVAESWRSSRSTAKRRDKVDDHLEDLGDQLTELRTQLEQHAVDEKTRWSQEQERNDELSRVLSQILDIGLRGGWVASIDGTPESPPPLQVASSIRDHLREAEAQGRPIRWNEPSSPSSSPLDEAPKRDPRSTS